VSLEVHTYVKESVGDACQVRRVPLCLVSYQDSMAVPACL
jgi:hypothetical protein